MIGGRRRRARPPTGQPTLTGGGAPDRIALFPGAVLGVGPTETEGCVASWPGSLLRLAAATPLLLSACGSTNPRAVQPETDLHHPSATRRLEAVATVTNSRDMGHVPALIEMLEDPDAGVRMTAGQSLKDLTGRDTGYRPYGPPEERARQAAEWRAWWASRRTGTAGTVREVRPDAGRP